MRKAEIWGIDAALQFGVMHIVGVLGVPLLVFFSLREFSPYVLLGDGNDWLDT